MGRDLTEIIICKLLPERFRSMGPMYYRGAHAAILVYDITSQESFLEMDAWAKGMV